MSQNELENWGYKHLANFGYTASGSAVVDALWFSSPLGSIGLVLTLNEVGEWKAWIGLASTGVEDVDANRIAEIGSKLPCAIAMAAFPARFEEVEYGS